jgi:chemotaxis protein histidine kinase CheA/ActR/RegA family two-component response regulator
MSGTESGDELAILIASFIEEVKPFIPGIRQGVQGIFALPRESQAIEGARGSLSTLAGSARMFDLPAARHLAELAQLLLEGFGAAERGGVPVESRTPMLTMVDYLEAQFDSLEAGDERGRERLDHSYRLLEQVLQTVEEAETAAPPSLDIALDDLLLTLQPTAAPEPEPEPLPLAAEPLPEPSQTELQLLAEDTVAPIEWGEKEAILWNKGGWDESQTAYGNTEWIFLDEEEIANVGAAQASAPADVADDLVVELAVTAPLTAPDAADTPTAAVDEAVAQTAAASADEAQVASTDIALSAEPLAVTGELPALDAAPEGADDLVIGATGDLAAAEYTAELPELGATGDLAHADLADDTLVADTPVADAVLTPVESAPEGEMALDAAGLEEAALLALSSNDLDHYLELEGADQTAFLRERMREMVDFATDLGIAVDRSAVAARDTGDLSALLSDPVSPTGDLPAPARANGHRAPSISTDALIAPVTIVPLSGQSRRRPALPSHGPGTDRLLATENAPASMPVFEDESSFSAVEAAPAVETPTESFANTLEGEIHAAASPTAPVEDDSDEVESVAVDAIVLTEYHPSEHSTGSLARDSATLAATVAEEADDRLLATGALLPDPAAGESADNEDGADNASFLDALLDDDGDAPTYRLIDGDDELLDTDTDDLDPNFAALPDVAPELEAAFARLSDADINTFLTLDGDAALAFLQSRADEAAALLSAADESPRAAGAAAGTPDVVAEDVVDESAAEPANFGLDQEILEVFLQEAQELLAEWGTTARQLRRAPADSAAMADLRRVAHTLKGAANMMGFTVLGAAGWRVEHLLDLLDERGLTAAPPVLDFVDRTYALVSQMSADASADPRQFAEADAGLEARHRALAAEIEAGALPTVAREPEDELTSIATASESASAIPSADDAVDGELLDIFVQEAEDHLGAFNRALVALDRRPSDRAQLDEAKRVIHTLKGAAAALGYPVTAALCHSIEDLFSTLDESGREPSREMLTLFFESAEALEALVAGITAGRGEDSARSDALRQRYAALLGQAIPQVQADPVAPAAAAEDLPRAENAPRSVRVDIAHLDNLLNLVGELVINRTSQEQHLERLGRSVSELLLSVERLRRVGTQLESRYEVAELLRGESPRAAQSSATNRPHLSLVGPTVGDERGGGDEFDALEMDRYTELHRFSRELVEIAADINTAGNELEGLYDSFDQTLSRQGRIATDLQDKMMEVRLVPLSTLTARLYRAVRGVAMRRGRATELVIEGETVEIDKVLLEEITDPLLHLVRNAADHGIESPELRRQRGKPATGTIRLTAAREGNEAVIRVQDDGAGIDPEQVLDKALARGIIRQRDGLTREQILDLIFLPGFSTSPTVSDISGRGVGLDVVRTNVNRLKGSLDVDSTVGAGTTFTIRLPIMLAVTRALLVRSGAQTFAIPLPVVEQVAFFRKELVSTLGGNELFDLGGEAYPVLYLNRALGLGGGTDAAGGSRVLIVGNADRRIALVVDELVGQQEVVVKRLGRHLQSVAGVAGATILGSGQVVLILNVLDLIGSRRNVRGGATTAPQAPTPLGRLQPTDGARVAMVVDDSLSVRRVLTRTLERDGWQVLGAKDGVEALEMLAWARPQVLVLDIEMPRMDGYELTSLLRNHPDHSTLPIAMLTSRAGEKHRRKALELGVSAYLVKPFEEAELLRTVRELSGVARRQTAG